MASLIKEQLWVSIFHKQANLSNYKIKNIKTLKHITNIRPSPPISLISYLLPN